MFVFLLMVGTGGAEILFEDSFDSHPDWTTSQPVYPSNVGNALCDGAVDGSTACSDCPQGDAKYWGRYIGTSAWSGYKGEETVQIDSANARGGSGKAATFWMEPIDTTRCDGGSMWCSDAQMAVRLPEAQDTIFIRYYIKFQPDWVWDTTSGHSAPSGKIVHAAHNHDIDGSGCFQAFSNGQMFPAIVQNIGNEETFYQSDAFNLRATVRFQSSYYGGYGDPDPVYLDAGSRDFARAWIPGGSGTAGYNGHKTWEESMGDGEWHSVEIQLSGNSAMGAEDGIFRMWYDGEEILDLDRVAYADNQYWDECNNCLNPPRDFVGWNMVSIGGNFYNRAYPEDTHIEQWYAIDDFVVSTEYIGPDYVIGEGSSCVSDLVNSSWSVWGDVGTCRVNDTVLQERSLTQSDYGGCVGDVLFSESQEVGCSYEVPSVGVIFEDDFDSHEDWHVPYRGFSVTWPSATATDFPSDNPVSGPRMFGYSGQNSVIDDQPNYRITLFGDAGRGGGKGLRMRSEAIYGQDDVHSVWYSDTQTYYTLTENPGDYGYDEIWIQMWRRYGPDFYSKTSGAKYMHASHFRGEHLNDWHYDSEVDVDHAPFIVLSNTAYDGDMSCCGSGSSYDDLSQNWEPLVKMMIREDPYEQRADYRPGVPVEGSFHHESSGTYYGDYVYPGGSISGSWQDFGRLGDEEWHYHEVHLKMNSAPGTNDGELGYYIDGVAQMIFDDVPWIQSGGEMVGWNMVSPGGNQDFHTLVPGGETYYYDIDDFVVSTNRVGSDYVIGGWEVPVVVCVHDADLEPCDGSVSTGELVAYLEMWSRGEVLIGDVLEAVEFW